MEGLEIPFKTITTGISDIFNSIVSILSYLNPFDDNFILKDVINFLSNILSYINPFSDDFLGKKIISLLGDLLEYLFVPKEDHFSEIKTIIDEKFGFVNQITELVSMLTDFNRSSSTFSEVPPSFTITYMGVTVEIVDFSVIEPFRSTLHAIICACLWVPYLINLFRRIPAIIDGFEGTWCSHCYRF